MREFECGLHPLLLVKFAARAKNPRGWQQRVKFKTSHLPLQLSVYIFHCQALSVRIPFKWGLCRALYLDRWRRQERIIMTQDCFNLTCQRLKTRTWMCDVRNLFANSIRRHHLCFLRVNTMFCEQPGEQKKSSSPWTVSLVSTLPHTMSPKRWEEKQERYRFCLFGAAGDKCRYPKRNFNEAPITLSNVCACVRSRRK